MIVPDAEPNEWVSKSYDRLRVCLDPTDLNEAILLEHYPMKTLEEVVARMPNAKVFSVIDATSEY